MPPTFFSLEFHTRFFPSLLRNRLRPEGRSGTGFSSQLEFPVVFVVCCVLIAIGLPMAIDDKSFVGWVIGGIGGAGMLALVIHSIASRGNPPDYDDFLTGFFCFFVPLGLTAGVFAGSLGDSVPLGLLIGFGGLVGGYLLGILAGLWCQYLGWIAVMVNGLAWLAVIGMLCVDLVIVGGFLF